LDCQAEILEYQGLQEKGIDAQSSGCLCHYGVAKTCTEQRGLILP
jgi:hypothetical protein